MGPLQEYAKKLLIYSTLTFDPPWTGLLGKLFILSEASTMHVKFQWTYECLTWSI